MCIDPLIEFLTNLQWAFGGGFVVYVAILLYGMFAED